MASIRLEGKICTLNRLGTWECATDQTLADLLNDIAGLNMVETSHPDQLLAQAELALSLYGDGEIIGEGEAYA